MDRVFRRSGFLLVVRHFFEDVICNLIGNLPESNHESSGSLAILPEAWLLVVGSLLHTILTECADRRLAPLQSGRDHCVWCNHMLAALKAYLVAMCKAAITGGSSADARSSALPPDMLEVLMVGLAHESFPLLEDVIDAELRQLWRASRAIPASAFLNNLVGSLLEKLMETLGFCSESRAVIASSLSVVARFFVTPDPAPEDLRQLDARELWE